MSYGKQYQRPLLDTCAKLRTYLKIKKRSAPPLNMTDVYRESLVYARSKLSRPNSRPINTRINEHLANYWWYNRKYVRDC